MGNSINFYQVGLFTPLIEWCGVLLVFFGISTNKDSGLVGKMIPRQVVCLFEQISHGRHIVSVLLHQYNSMITIQRLLNILLLGVVYLRINFRGFLCIPLPSLYL